MIANPARRWVLWPIILVLVSLIGGWTISTALHRRAQRQGDIVLATSAIALSAFDLSASMRRGLAGSPVALRQIEASEAVLHRELARLEAMAWDPVEIRWMRYLIGAAIESRMTLAAPMAEARREYVLSNLRINLGKLTASAAIALNGATHSRSDAISTLYVIYSATFATALAAVVAGMIGYLRQQQIRDRYERSLRDANASLRKHAEDMEQLVYAASHDLREPLRAVHVYSDLLAQRLSPTLAEDSRRHFGFVKQGTARMQSLLDDLMKLALLDRDETETAFFPAREAIDEAVGAYPGRFSEIGGRLVVDDALPSLEVNRSRFTQVVQNLVGNALKYREPSRPLEVRVSVADDAASWRFAVEDNGVGIPEPHRENIFKLFRRLHGPEIEGTGAGLAICRKIVDRWGGRIWVETAGTVGSRFVFTVPKEGHPDPEPSRGSDAASASGRGR
ncbi:MAG TPA: ATP-binding protein [Planctomycetota bacterium]|nr:ATP-binding protein [Planctomycetota bacterium]